jgi:ribokinase
VGDSGAVVSLGSVNLDRVVEVDDGELRALDDRYDWFPGPGETVRVPDGDRFAVEADRVGGGGKGANQALAAARAGATTALLGVVGEDGQRALGDLRAAGVDVDGVDRVAGPTGSAHVFVGPDGQNRVVVDPGANAALDDEYVRERYGTVVEADCLLLQNEVPTAPVGTLLTNLDRLSAPPAVVLDPAPVAGVESLLDHRSVAYLAPNDPEYDALSPVLGEFGGTVVRKRGPDPVLVEDGESFSVSVPPVEVVDTTGAGDAFAGYLGARLAAGDSLRAAVETAAVAAAMSTRERGARAGIPTMEAVRAFRRSRGRGPVGLG